MTETGTKKLPNRVERGPHGGYCVVWQGDPVHDSWHSIRYFGNEADAWQYLFSCERAGRLIDGPTRGLGPVAALGR